MSKMVINKVPRSFFYIQVLRLISERVIEENEAEDMMHLWIQDGFTRNAVIQNVNIMVETSRRVHDQPPFAWQTVRAA